MGIGHEIWHVEGTKWALVWEWIILNWISKEYDGEASIWLRE